jgi:hypothetical protein
VVVVAPAIQTILELVVVLEAAVLLQLVLLVLELLDKVTQVQ